VATLIKGEGKRERITIGGKGGSMERTEFHPSRGSDFQTTVRPVKGEESPFHG